MNRVNRVAAPLAAFGLAFLFATASPGGQTAAPVDAATEANIIRVTAGILGNSQFAHHPLDGVLASTFFDRYLDTLDGDRSLFLQTDLAQFAAYRATLARDTVLAGDGRAAHAVFDRYLERLGQRVSYVSDRLRTATFDFTGDDVYSLDRKTVPRPRDLAAARELWWQQLRFQYLQEKLDGKSPEQIAARLTRRANRQLRAMAQLSRIEVLELYLSALARVYDPHSDYLGHDQMDDFAISMNLSLFGIGAKLQSVDGYCKIVDLLPGGPALRSGQLAPNDRIVAVAQHAEEPIDVVDMPLPRIVDLIRGPKETVVSLTVIPADAGDDSVRRTVRLVRDEIKLADQRAKAKIIDLPHGHGETLRLGVIDLPSFYSDLSPGLAGSDGAASTNASATVDVARLLAKLKAENVRGVVLDLRRNGGGALDEAIKLTGLFIAQGPVVQTRGFNGDVDIGADTDPSAAWSGPLVVLTSRFSASASEILAGALQDYDRAILVGDASTFGKGTVQSVVPLAPLMDRTGLRYTSEPGAIKVTIRKFYRPSGSSTQLRGVVPDIVVPSPSGASDVGESTLKNPLPWDTVPRADYRPLPALDPYLATLREASARRVNGTQDFNSLRAEIARVKERSASKTVSLNEARRRQELARFEERKNAHEAVLAALRSSAPVSYEITLDNVALPGLPPPTQAAGDKAPGRRGPPGADSDDPESSPANEAPQLDLILKEAERILADYTSLLVGSAGRGTGQAQVVGAR